jgi:hypothetical protein
MRKIIFAVFLLCLCGFCRAGLVVEYKFDGGGIDTGSDGSVVDNLTSSGQIYRQGVMGEALCCDSNIFTAADSADLDLASQYAIEAFIRPTSSSGLQYIFYKDSYKIGIQDGNLGVLHRQSNSAIIGDFSVPITLNKWHHVAVTANGSSLILYVDGKAAKTFSYNGTIYNSAVSLSVGGFSGGNYYKGQIDDVRMFNTVKSASYIASRAAYSCVSLPIGDVNGDCRITNDDLLVLAEQWLACDSGVRTGCP